MIPKVFHQVWINRSSAELPEPFRSYRDSWLALHPDWQYRLWNLDNLDFRCMRAELLPQCTSYAQLADVLRLEVLYRHGGVYVDTDFECFRPIDALLEGVRAFACSENGMVLSSAFIGAEPGSPLVERLLKTLPERLGAALPNIETGPGHLTRQILGGGFRAGEFALLPSAWFYPYAKGEPPVRAGDCPQAYAAHHWALSWFDPRERRLIARARAKLFGRRKPAPMTWVRDTAAVRGGA